MRQRDTRSRSDDTLHVEGRLRVDGDRFDLLEQLQCVSTGLSEVAGRHPVTTGSGRRLRNLSVQRLDRGSRNGRDSHRRADPATLPRDGGELFRGGLTPGLYQLGLPETAPAGRPMLDAPTDALMWASINRDVAGWQR